MNFLWTKRILVEFILNKHWTDRYIFVTYCNWSGGAAKSHMQVAQLPVLENSKCRRVYELRVIDERVMCAGVTGKDSCNGDSGGPLMQPNVSHSAITISNSSVLCCDQRKMQSLILPKAIKHWKIIWLIYNPRKVLLNSLLTLLHRNIDVAYICQNMMRIL